jgi:hypothetical protein
MDISELKSRVAVFFKRGLGKLKETFSLPYAKTYLLLSLIITVLITVVIFPYDMLLRNKLQKLEKEKYLHSIYIGNIDASLIDVTVIESIHTVLKNRDELTMGYITLNPTINPYTLFYKKNIKSDLEISKFNYKTSKADVTLNLNGNIDIVMDSNFSMIKEGSIELMIQNALVKIPEIKIPSPMGEFPLTLPPVKITSINFESSILNREVKIKKLNISGQDLRGSIKGSIKLANITSNSSLNLTITIDPESNALTEYRGIITGLVDKKGMISISLKGTLAHPRADMEQSLKEKKSHESFTKTSEKPFEPEGRVPGIRRKK